MVCADVLDQKHFFFKLPVCTMKLEINRLLLQWWGVASAGPWKSGSCFCWQNCFVAAAEMQTKWEFVWLDQVFTVAQWLLLAAGKQWKSVSVLRKRGVWIPFESEHEKTGSPQGQKILNEPEWICVYQHRDLKMRSNFE